MTAAKLMGVRVNLQERFQYSPQVARDANASRGLVGWGACTLILGWWIQYSYD